MTGIYSCPTATKKEFPFPSGKVITTELERDWECTIRPLIISLLRTEGIIDCIRTVHLSKYGYTEDDAKVMVRIQAIKPFPERVSPDPTYKGPKATYDSLLTELIGGFGLEYEIVWVDMVAADTWGRIDDKKGCGFHKAL
jgi:hypothetical protein